MEGGRGLRVMFRQSSHGYFLDHLTTKTLSNVHRDMHQKSRQPHAQTSYLLTRCYTSDILNANALPAFPRVATAVGMGCPGQRYRDRPLACDDLHAAALLSF